MLERWRFLACFLLLVGCAGTPPAATQADWVADRKSGCRLEVPLDASGAGSWATWQGACVNGLADGRGHAQVTRKAGGGPGLPAMHGDFYGTFTAGQPAGLLNIGYSTGLHALARFDNGVLTGTPWLDVTDARYEWVITRPALLAPWLRSGATLPLALRAPYFGTPAEQAVNAIQLDDAAFADLDALFSGDRVADEPAYQTALQAAFPTRAPAPRLLAYLRTVAVLGPFPTEAHQPWVGCLWTDDLGPAPTQAGWYCHGFRSRSVGHGNSDAWGFGFTLTAAGTILDERYVLVFKGSDFAARHTALRVENFEDSVSFLSAARAVLGPNPDEAAVTTLMAQAGMLPGLPFALQEPNDGRHRLTFYQWGNVFTRWVTGCRQVISESWVFDPKTGRMIDAKPAADAPCLPGPAL